MDRFMEDLVIDIGDIADKGDVITALHQPTTQNIEVNTASNMAYVRGSLNGCATNIDRDFAALERREINDLAARSVIESNRHQKILFHSRN